MQCTYNVTFMGVRATIVALGKKYYYIFWVCICSLSYPACNAHAPYWHLWSVWLHQDFSNYLINGTILDTVFPGP